MDDAARHCDYQGIITGQAAGPRTRHHRRNIFMIGLFLEKCFHVTATTSFPVPAITVDDNVQYEVINNQNKAP